MSSFTAQNPRYSSSSSLSMGRGRSTRKFWTTARESRLFEWIEENPLEFRALFIDQTDARVQKPLDNEGNPMTKTSCHNRAAQFIFAVDEDVSVRRMLEENHGLRTLGVRVRNQISSWKKKFEDINDDILRIRPGQNLEDIRIGTQIYQELSRYHSRFPLWGRLHAHRYNVSTTSPTASQNNVAVHNQPSNNRSPEDRDSDAGDVDPRIEECIDRAYRRPEMAEGSTRPLNSSTNPRSETAIQRVENSNISQQHESQVDLTPEQRIRLQALENEASRIRGVQEVVMEFVRRYSAETGDKI